MSITYLDLTFKNPQHPRKKAVGHFLVDSGAIYSVVPATILKEIGIKPTHRQKFTLANGEVIEKGVGQAFFEYQKKVGSSPVIFGEEGIFLLGAVTLKSLGVILDPINRELKPLPMLLMSFLDYDQEADDAIQGRDGIIRRKKGKKIIGLTILNASRFSPN